MALNDSDLEAMRTMVQSAVQAMGQALDDFNRKAKESAGHDGGLARLNTIVGSMTKNLVGPVGLAAGIYSAAKSMEEFAQHQVRMASFARDTGFATQNVEQMQQAMRRMGMSVNEAQTTISTLGQKLQNLGVFKEGSDLFRTLSSTQGGAALAYNLMNLVKAGDQIGAVNELLKTFAKQTNDAKIFLAQALGTSVSVLEDLASAQRRNLEIWEVNREEAQKYHDMWVDFEVEFRNIFDSITNHGIEKFHELSESFGAKNLDENAHTIANVMNAQLDRLSETIKTDIQDLESLKKAFDTYILKQPFGHTFDFLNKTPAEILKEHPLSNLIAPPAHADTRPTENVDQSFANAVKGMKDRSFEPAVPFGTSDAAAKITEGNVTLGDIRDILKRMEDKQNGISSSGGGGGSGAGSGGGAASDLGLGITPGNIFGGIGKGDPANKNIPGGGPIQMPSDHMLDRGAGEHPFHFPQRGSAGGGGGITAPAGTAIQHSGMATVTAPDGKKFQVDARFKDNFQGFINDYYSAGGKFGSATGTLGSRPHNASGHPIGTAIDINQIGRDIRGGKGGVTLDPTTENALAAKWGFVSGNQWHNPDTGHFGIRSEKAAKEALIRNGMMPSDAEKMTGASDNPAVKGSFFTDHTTASGVDASKVAGIALPSREHLGKMFNVTGPDGRTQQLRQIDVGPAKWTGRGIDFSGPAKNQLGYDPTDKSFTYSLVDERSKIDRVQRGTGTIGGKVSAAIEFLNVPKNVKTTGEAQGDIFHDVQINRTRQAGVYRSDSQAYE